MMRATCAGLAMLLLFAAAAKAQPQNRFDWADRNHDGRVTLQEYESFVENRMARAKGEKAQRFRSLDPEKQATMLQHRFDKLDKDHKGYLVPADWKSRRG